MSEQKSKDEGRSIPVVIATVLLLAGFVLQFFGAKQSLPIEVQVSSALIVGVSAALFVVWVWYRSFQRWYGGWRRNRIARKHFPELVRLFERFEEFVDRGVSQPTFFLYQLKGKAEFSGIPLPFYPNYPAEFAVNMQFGLKSRNRNLDSFLWYGGALGGLVTWYNEAYLSTPVKAVQNMIKLSDDEGGPPEDMLQVPEGIRKGFNSARASWVRFLQDFDILTTNVSKELGQYQMKVANEWHPFNYLNPYRFEPPEELPGPAEF